MIGRSLRQYVITAQLGQGGMGVVWKARDTILEREVALKVLPSQYISDQERKDRFFREARAASALNHPNIVTIYEINSDQGIDFIAMEYLAGDTLATLIRRRALTVDDALRFAVQIADGVGRAHRAGIVHRDLKPGNIIVTNDDLVKVLDFGLAKAWAESPPRTSDAVTMVSTQVGTSVGTLGYMSPEQALGDHVDARSDVFALGVVLYQMLARSLPFVAATPGEMLRKLHFEEPIPLATLCPEVPAALADIVARSLAKDRDDRPASCMEVAAALREVQSLPSARDSSVTSPAQAVGTGDAVASGVVRRRLPGTPRPVITIVAALAIVVAAAAGVWWLMTPGGTAEPERATPTRAEVADPADLSRQAADLLARYDRDGNVDRAIATLERALSANPGYATAHAYLSQAYLRKHLTNPDPQWLNLSRDAAERAVDLGSDLAISHLAFGRALLEQGEREHAANSFRRAADLDPVNPMPHVGLGMVFSAAREDDKAEQELLRGVELAPDATAPQLELGQFYFTRARYEDALSAWEEVRRLTPDNVIVLRNLSAAYYFLGRHDEAASSLQRSLEVRPSAATYTNLGTIRFFQGRYTDAVAAFEKAVELTANSHLYWANLGDGYRWAPGRRGEAAAAYRRAAELIKEQIGQKPSDADLRTRHATYLIKMGETREALDAIREVATQSDLSATMRYRLAIVYELAGDREQALRSIEGALNAGYPVSELQREPELLPLRNDSRYHRLIDRHTSATKK
jgi:eukaryotic-like serine/threonine-protein kinase